MDLMEIYFADLAASYLYQSFLYDWLDRNGHGRYQADGDL
jgi:hypothetical protein